MQFYESIFLSELAPEVLPSEIGRLVRVSRANNAAQALTGVLMFDGERFCQQLEGPETSVKQTLAKIEVDPRHRGFQLLHTGVVGASRRFDNWHVGILAPDGPSPLHAFRSVRGIAAVDLLVSIFTQSDKFGLHVL